MTFWDAIAPLPSIQILFLLIALLIAFGFEFINGFHDTANAVTTVIYTRTLTPNPAVFYSAMMNFLGVLLGGTTVAFSIVNLLPVDLLVNAGISNSSLVMVLSLLLAGVIWNLGTWYLGLPVSSSHTLIGAILGVGLANGLLAGNGLHGVNWSKVGEVGLALLLSPMIGFLASALLLLFMKRTVRDPQLYVPPEGDARPPRWVRFTLIGTCGGVGFAHGSNDGQKGMGLILLVLIGFVPYHYALNTNHPQEARTVHQAVQALKKELKLEERPALANDLEFLDRELSGRSSFTELPRDYRWEVRQAIFRINRALQPQEVSPQIKKQLSSAIEFVPFWVVFGVALSLGVGTTIGYKRIVITVAEKIGKSHLTYAQGAAAELVASATILLADIAHAPVSTTQVLSSGIAGTMAANGSGIQGATCQKILLAWVLTLPSTMFLAGAMFTIGQWLFG